MRPSTAGRLMLAAFVGLGLAACRGDGPPPSDPSVQMTVRISPTPATLSAARVLVSLEDTAGLPLPDAVVLVTGQMSHAGMVPVVDTAREEAPGRYAVPDYGFTMAGDWVLEVRARFPDGRTAAADQPIRVVAMGGAPPPDAPGDTGGASPAAPSDTSEASRPDAPGDTARGSGRGPRALPR